MDVTGVTIREGDILDKEVSALVNPVDTALQMNSGLAAALVARAGEQLEADCKERAPIELGAATETRGGGLPATWVFHAALMEPGGRASEDSLRAAFRACLALAEARQVERLAVPPLGVGEGGLSMQRSAEILLEEARGYFDATPKLEEIRFVLDGEPTYRLFEMVNDSAKVAEQMARLKRRS